MEPSALQHDRYFSLLSKHFHLNKLSKQVNKNAFLNMNRFSLDYSIHYKG